MPPLNSPTLGPSVASAAVSADAPGRAAWLAIAQAFAGWLPGASQFVATAGAVPLVSAAGVITGTGALVIAGASALGPLLATAAGSTDAAGQARWAAIGAALAAAVGTAVYATGLIGFVSGTAAPGPVTGVATITIPNMAIDLATPAGSTDAAGIAAWSAIAIAILTHVQTNAQITPIMTNPGTGGPVAGTGALA
jgi:hypothetical protein